MQKRGIDVPTIAFFHDLIPFNEVVLTVEPKRVGLFMILKCKSFVVKWVIKFFRNVGRVLNCGVSAI